MKTSRIALLIAVSGLALAAASAYATSPNEWQARIASLQQSVLGKPNRDVVDVKPASGAKSSLKPSVRVVNPLLSSAAGTISLTGRTTPLEQSLVAARATGYVQERRVDIGDKVKTGDVLLIIDAPEIPHQIARAKAAVQMASARRQLAEATLERGQTLAQSGTLSKQVRDERVASELTAEADFAAAEADVARLEEVRKYLTVRAPFDGTIVSRQVERGDRVSGGDNTNGSALFRVARLDELRIEIDVPQVAALSVVPGSQAKVTFAELPGQTFEAKVSRVSRLIAAESATMRAELTMPNPREKIPAGLSGQVQLALVRDTEAVTVPSNTLLVRNGQQHVAIVDQAGAVRFKRVAVSRDLGNRIEIVTGLTTADRVILSPNALIRDGDEVAASLATPTT